jgi:hypothetical protein
MIPAEVRAQVIASRRAQGLPDHITAQTFHDQLARKVLPDNELIAERAMTEDNGAPGTRVPGRRDHPAAAKTKRGRPHATP